jgi:hypothetical protein
MDLIPMVGGLGFKEALRRQPQSFTARLVAEPDNRYNLWAVAVLGETGDKIGYVVPEVARHYFARVKERTAAGQTVTCPCRLVQNGPLDVLAVVDLGQLHDLREP